MHLLIDSTLVVPIRPASVDVVLDRCEQLVRGHGFTWISGPDGQETGVNWRAVGTVLVIED